MTTQLLHSFIRSPSVGIRSLQNEGQDYRRVERKIHIRGKDDVPLDLSPTWQQDTNPAQTINAILFPAHDPYPRTISIPWTYKEQTSAVFDCTSHPIQILAPNPWTHNARSMDIGPVDFMGLPVTLPQDRSYNLWLRDDGSFENRCIRKVTEGRGNWWGGDVVVLRKSRALTSEWEDGVLEEDVPILKEFWIEWEDHKPF